MKSSFSEKLVLIFGLVVFGIGCNGSEPEKLPGEDLLLAVSPNWQYYEAVKAAVKVWDEDITLEPRIFRQKGMKNVFYFTGDKCRLIGTEPLPLDQCAAVLKGVAGRDHRQIPLYKPSSHVMWINVDFNKLFEKDPMKLNPYYVASFQALHELGHFLGLKHSDNRRNLMYRDISIPLMIGNIHPTYEQKDEIRNKHNIRCGNRFLKWDSKIIYVMM